jgi:hypothetical protein
MFGANDALKQKEIELLDVKDFDPISLVEENMFNILRPYAYL